MRKHLALLVKNAFDTSSKSCYPKIKNFSYTQIRCMSFQESIAIRNEMFSAEKKRQEESIGRIEKIEVRYMGVPKDETLIMNKDLSTPYDCARHLSETHVKKSALALVDGTLYWDMHRPLTQSCTLELQHFTIADPYQVNRAFWRTCSFLLGATVSRAFKNTFDIRLHSFPAPDIRSGSFVYDVELVGLSDWKPEPWEYRALSAEFVKITRTEAPLERLVVSEKLASEMFQSNPHKTKQIPDIAKKNEGNITLYRVLDHVDISKGPMISHVGQIGRVSVTAAHILGTYNNLTLHRFQGVSLPSSLIINHMAYSILEKRAAKLNPAKSPLEIIDSEDIPQIAVG